MRLVLAFLAVLALLSTPVTAAAAQVACSQPMPMAMGMDMPGMEQADVHAAGDPCCDHGDQHPQPDKSCAQACAAMCGVVVPMASPFGATLSFVSAPLTALAAGHLRSHKPAGLDRPPKPIA
jgi:hypothetical protein